MPPTGDLDRNPHMRPDWELNLWPFASQAHTQSTKLYQLGLNFLSFSFLTHDQLFIFHCPLAVFSSLIVLILKRWLLFFLRMLRLGKHPFSTKIHIHKSYFYLIKILLYSSSENRLWTKWMCSLRIPFWAHSSHWFCGSGFVDCRIFRTSVTSTHLMPASSPQLWQAKMSPDIIKCPSGEEEIQVNIACFEDSLFNPS